MFNRKACSPEREALLSPHYDGDDHLTDRSVYYKLSGSWFPQLIEFKWLPPTLHLFSHVCSYLQFYIGIRGSETSGCIWILGHDLLRVTTSAIINWENQMGQFIGAVLSQWHNFLALKIVNRIGSHSNVPPYRWPPPSHPHPPAPIVFVTQVNLSAAGFKACKSGDRDCRAKYRPISFSAHVHRQLGTHLVLVESLQMLLRKVLHLGGLDLALVILYRITWNITSLCPLSPLSRLLSFTNHSVHS